jgi:hypothetical protein
MKLLNRRLLTTGAAIAALGLTAGCTPNELRAWTEWHAQDPTAAEAFANTPEVAASLATGEHEQDNDEPAVEAASSGRGGCDGIYDELRRQGASDGVAQRLAYRIAPRESGCSPQFVHDHDDWSYSRFGLNGLTQGLRNNWMNWCGADVRSDTQNLSTDVRCALEAHARMGWSPWGG